MPFTTTRRHHHHRTAVLALGAAFGACAMLPVQAQQAGEGQGASDPSVVITRTVQPRIAYRGVPVDDMPIHAEATTFPGKVFHNALGNVLDQLVGDDLLGQRGSVGLLGESGKTLTGQSLLPDAAMLGPSAQGGLGRVPTGPGAAIGGAVSGATAGLGDRIGGSVMRAVTPTNPVQGGGP